MLLFFLGLIWMLLWAAVTIMPALMAVGAWKLSRVLQHGWIAHVLFLPALAVSMWLGVRLLFFAAGDDGDGPPGLGLAMIPTLFVFAGSVLSYFAVLAAKLLQKVFYRVGTGVSPR